MKNLAPVFVVLVILCLVSGCGKSGATAMPKPTNTSLSTDILATNTPEPTHTPIPPMETATLTATPTATPRPQFDPSSFVFPYDLADVLAQRANIPYTDQFFTYHITDRPDANDPCGRHPGDILVPLGVNQQPAIAFDFPVVMPYDGKLERSWVTQVLGPNRGGDLGFTFYVGDMDGHRYYLDVYHTDTSQLEIGDFVPAGQVFAHQNRAKDNGLWVSVVHLTLLVDGTDFMSTQTADIAPFAIPPTLKVAHAIGENVVLRFEGPNYCNMDSPQKIAALLNDYLPNAGFCVEGNSVNYCGANPAFQGLAFTQQTFDERSVILYAQSQ
jgi:hypothetical protein